MSDIDASIERILELCQHHPDDLTIEERYELRDMRSNIEQYATNLLINYVAPKRQVAVAQRMLVHVLDNNLVDYGTFEAAKAAKRYIKQARNALRGLSLV